MFAKLADVVTKHSKAVIAVWIVIVLCCVPFIMKANDVLEYDLTNMMSGDSESAKGNAIMSENFSNAVGMDEVLVVDSVDSAVTGALSTKVKELFGVYNTEHGSDLNLQAVGTYGNISLYSISDDFGKVDFTNDTGDIRNIISDAKAAIGSTVTTYVTGNAALTFDTMDASNGDIAKIDPLSVALIFILLALFFGALATAIVPPVGFGVAYAVAMLALYAFGSVTGVFYLTSTLMMVTMLGAGCDYGIFIITRYREELKKGESHTEALKTSVMWAGESVFTSGMSVIIGFACLAICDFSLVRNMGVMLAAGIVFALVSALTFTPALINIIGEKVFWPKKIADYKAVDDGTRTGVYARVSKFFSGYFRWVSRVTHKYAAPIVAVFIVVSVPAGYIYFTTDSSYDMIAVEPDGEAKEGLYKIMDNASGGTLMPTYAVIGFPESAIGGEGTLDLMGPVSYLQWSPAALTTGTSGFTGYVPDIMKVANDIVAQNSSIVDSASGLNSWQVLFAQAYVTGNVYQKICDGFKTQAHDQVYDALVAGFTAQAHDQVYNALKDGYYAEAYDTVLAQVSAAHPEYTAEQAAAAASALTTQKAIEYADANIDATLHAKAVEYADANIDATLDEQAREYADAHMYDSEYVDEVNRALVSLMPSAVQGRISTYITFATSYAAATGQSAVPTMPVDASGVTLANLIDYVLNVGTGLLSDDGKYVSVMIVTNEMPMSDNTMAFIPIIRAAFNDDGGYCDTYSGTISELYITGTNAQMHDISESVNDQFKVIQVVVILLLLLLLFVILGCYLTPIRAMVCIMASVIWTLALTYVVFQDLLNTPVCWILPIVLFVVLLGLGMDYDIFITTRVRENKLRGMDNDEAIDSAICTASGTISLCALIMGGTFLTLLLGSSSMLVEFGFALGIGILLDGLFMVTFVGPALMHLMGEWSWKGPAFLQKKHI